uniref:Uncharacterized protein n=1 Tax=Oryza glumipatula TaxID=40148 RepID=A0A0E0BDJ6_9ORYZ
MGDELVAMMGLARELMATQCPDLVVAIGGEARVPDLVITDGGRWRREQGARSPVRVPCRWR